MYDLLFDPDSPDWKDQVMRAAVAIEESRKREAWDQAGYRARRMMAEDPWCALAMLSIMRGELREQSRAVMLELLASSIRDLVRQEMADQMPEALGLLVGGRR